MTITAPGSDFKAPLRCKPKLGVRRSLAEIRNALTAWRHSLEKRRIQANVCGRELTGAAKPTLRDKKWRTEFSLNVCNNWGYLAEECKRDGVNQQGVGIRKDRIWLPKRNTETNTVLESLRGP